MLQLHGSGKTAVLVERIINKAINENIDIDKLLVVTFTNAAAAEMKERVLNAIYQKLDENPENENLQRQVTLLNIANICTIDSFCLEVVKSHFYELENVSPNFRIADTAEIEMLKQQILDEIFEEKYLNENEDFKTLINTYTSYRDDSPLKELILNIYSYISSSPYPIKWLNEKIEMQNLGDRLEDGFEKTIWGKNLLNQVEEEVIDDIAILQDVLNNILNEEQLEIYRQIVESDIKQLQTLKQNLNNWDKAYQTTKIIKFEPWPKNKIESDKKTQAKEIRDDIKKKFYKKINKIFVSDSKQSQQDIFEMYKILKKLENLIVEFDEKFIKIKRDKNILDFTDIEHLALEILVKEVDEKGNIVKTETAKKYTEKFEEIAIDEYQDSNLVQELILTSISRGKNLFMVGDVKQSIYRFRQARPELFLEKYHNYKCIEESDKDSIGKKIQLFKNFRSRNGVLDFTNLIFENIMSDNLGEVEYNESEFLNYGAEDYKKNSQNLKTEIDIINLQIDKEKEEEEFDEDDYDEEKEDDVLEHIENIELEAKFVAKKIKNMIDDKFQIYDRKNEIFRDIRYSDIVILLRSTKDKAKIFEQEILNLGMPVFSDSNQEYLDSIEIQTIVSLLKIIDNPMQDIPLVSVLRSNIGKFTDNELVEIRLSDQYDNFYNCMMKARVKVKPELCKKIDLFLNQLKQWRKEQEYLSLGELIWKVYSDTGYYNYVGLMPNGQIRQANLKMLFERANKYETASFKGLYNFISFIDKIKATSGDLGSAKIIGENDNVIKIMSIHKSKGLEFPIVFLSNSNKLFNEQDIKNNSILMHQDVGLGAKYINYNAQIKYDTLTREVVKNVISIESISEEMRVLYVALTRAKEKLIITGISKKYEKQIEDLKKQIQVYEKNNGKINYILVKKYKSFLDWILLVYLYNKNDIGNLVDLNIVNPIDIVKDSTNLNSDTSSSDILEKLEDKVKTGEIDKIKNIIEFEYKDKISTLIPTKASVTQLKKDEEKEVSFERPAFIKQNEDDKISSAERGTLVHLCMQKLNPKVNYDLEKIKGIIKDMESKQIITQKQAEAINAYKVLQFTKTRIWNEMNEAKVIEREKPFYINIPAKDAIMQETAENILVQGIIDLYYIDKNNKLILLDYKTDYVESGNENELINKYENQLKIYQLALEQALGRKVDKIYIYSVYLEKVIELT